MREIFYQGQEIEVKQLKTKQLLSLLSTVRYRISEDYYLTEEEWKHDRTLRDWLKEELATREHIPNKLEAKEIRKQKMKEKRNR